MEIVMVKLSQLYLTRFLENVCNIYISKNVYYENIFNDRPNDTNYVT